MVRSMVPLVPAFAAVLVSFLYCACERVRQGENRRRRVMRERVAELLWAAAEHAH